MDGSLHILMVKLVEQNGFVPAGYWRTTLTSKALVKVMMIRMLQ